MWMNDFLVSFNIASKFRVTITHIFVLFILLMLENQSFISKFVTPYSRFFMQKISSFAFNNWEDLFLKLNIARIKITLEADSHVINYLHLSFIDGNMIWMLYMKEFFCINAHFSHITMYFSCAIWIRCIKFV